MYIWTCLKNDRKMDIKSQITGVQHIGVPTDDLAASVDFYRTLGFETEYETYNAAADERVTFMRLKNLVMEIYENRRATHRDGAVDHVALDVSRIDSLFAFYKGLGLKMLEDKVSYLPFWEHGIRYFIVVGPNDEKIEFCERLKEPFRG